jgi:hypothetical protein
MVRRIAVILLVIFEALWLNVILPGHTRGMVTMPCCACECSAAPAGACPHCCEASGAPHKPTPADRANCALCFFAAHLSIPPTIDMSAPKLRFLNYVGAESAKHLFARQVILPFDGTGPPPRG